MTEPLSPERLAEIRASIPTVYDGPWEQHYEMVDGHWLVRYPTDNPLAGLVAKVPDYGNHLAQFIAESRTAVPELLAEVERLRAENAGLNDLRLRAIDKGDKDRAERDELRARVAELETADPWQRLADALNAVAADDLDLMPIATQEDGTVRDAQGRVRIVWEPSSERFAVAAPHAFEKEYQGESDAKRRLARCKHCRQDRTAAVHTEADRLA